MILQKALQKCCHGSTATSDIGSSSIEDGDEPELKTLTSPARYARGKGPRDGSACLAQGIEDMECWVADLFSLSKAAIASRRRVRVPTASRR